MEQLICRLSLCILFISTLSACLSPITLNRAVMAYDEAVVNADAKQLLVNIARARHHQPLHFTRVSAIAATFNFSANAGASPALTGAHGGMLVPIFGGGVSENPTFSIEPIAGEEFTQRLLAPFSQHKFTLLLRQHFDVDLMLRMMAQEVTLLNLPAIQLDKKHEDRVRLPQQRYSQKITYYNSPSDREGYEMFRRVALHFSAIQDQKQLYAEPLMFERSWTIPAGAVSAEGFQSLQKEFTVRYNQKGGTYTLSKQVSGPILITNYDPDTLRVKEVEDLYSLANSLIDNDVIFDIRSGYVGGEWTLRGSFRLRSFHAILNFLGHSLGEEPEYHVEKDSRTPPILRDENPINTMEILVSNKPIPNTELSAHLDGQYYAINTKEPDAHWNQNAFQLLYILFRLTVTEAKSLALPITIAK
ncbi:hypothetical protein [Nitrosomonas communis]|uniref:Uncharacterized protein n=1 Tax=Nitrosomonas communis TaxID=44574 RepID=A0A1H2Y871_9PROT|nr:hypothetical protein [Nitrosomonas communis]SDX01413.1 hypothetical protein SAMN05421882_104810 [Nitrosomonas communis]